MFESFDLLHNALTAIVTAVVTLSGTFLYHAQERERREIENETKQSEEWKKLYQESRDDNAKKDNQIDELRREINNLRTEFIELERKCRLSAIYTCLNMRCLDRVNPNNHEQTKEQ